MNKAMLAAQAAQAAQFSGSEVFQYFDLGLAERRLYMEERGQQEILQMRREELALQERQLQFQATTSGVSNTWFEHLETRFHSIDTSLYLLMNSLLPFPSSNSVPSSPSPGAGALHPTNMF